MAAIKHHVQLTGLYRSNAANDINSTPLPSKTPISGILPTITPTVPPLLTPISIEPAPLINGESSNNTQIEAAQTAQHKDDIRQRISGIFF